MTCSMLNRIAFALLLSALPLALISCQKKPTTDQQVAAIDRVGDRPAVSSVNVLQKTFILSTTEAFPFEVPAHVAVPHLHGNYKSYLTKLGVQSSEHSADVDFFVFNEDQYSDFTAGTAGNAVFTSDPSNDQAVDVSLPPSLNESKKYYVVFRNTPGGAAKKTVQADLTVDF
jgi:hypothetical protein